MPHPKIFRLVMAGLILLSLFLGSSGLAQQPEPGAEAQALQEDAHEEIVPAPKDIKEAIGIYVFLGWIWISIFVLIFILRQKIKEADRITRLNNFSTDKD